MKSWLTQSGFGLEWMSKLDLSQSKGTSWEFAGLLRSRGDQVSIEDGNVIANSYDQAIVVIPKRVASNVEGDFSNQVIRTDGVLVDRNTIDGATYLTFENRHGRWLTNSRSMANSDAPMPLIFGATYSVTGLVTNSTLVSHDHSLVVRDESDIRYLAAPPLSPWHRLALSVLLTVLTTFGLCISLVSYRHLARVKDRLEIAQSSLHLANESLESKIDERTRELQSLNQALTIAERKANEANEAKSAFLANMSHEIRTPMTAILGFTEILRDDSDSTATEQQAFLDTIHRNGDHLLTIIDEILDLAKIESGKLSLNFDTVCPATLIEEVVSLLQVKATAKNLTLNFAVAPDAPTRIWTDATRLKQVLLNLIGNAIKFTEVGKVSVDLGLEPSRTNAVRIQVTDSGIGIDDGDLPRLFKAFEQSDSSLTRIHGGTGLGLSICKGVVTILGGDISVRSQLGLGSCFQVVLPIGSDLFRDSVSQPFAFPKQSNPPFHGLQNVRVLFAEDGVDNRKLIAFHLRQAGAEVTLVENGLQLVEALCGTQDAELSHPCLFDLVITDMQMPVMDGYTAVELLRSKGCNLPIVALTAHAMSEDSDKCLRAGCDVFLTKPIERSILLNSCSGLIQRKNLQSKIGPAA